jgi:hypothetical protein
MADRQGVFEMRESSIGEGRPAEKTTSGVGDRTKINKIEEEIIMEFTTWREGDGTFS